jgi:hypothetical protein
MIYGMSYFFGLVFIVPKLVQLSDVRLVGQWIGGGLLLTGAASFIGRTKL